MACQVCTSRGDSGSSGKPPVGEGQVRAGVRPTCRDLNRAEAVPQGPGNTCCDVSAQLLSTCQTLLGSNQ